jgi:hypothetical protein
MAPRFTEMAPAPLVAQQNSPTKPSHMTPSRRPFLMERDTAPRRGRQIERRSYCWNLGGGRLTYVLYQLSIVLFGFKGVCPLNRSRAFTINTVLALSFYVGLPPLFSTNFFCPALWRLASATHRPPRVLPGPSRPAPLGPRPPPLSLWRRWRRSGSNTAAAPSRSGTGVPAASGWRGASL